MPFLSELDVVNQCLATQGEAPLNAIDTDHPYVPAAQFQLSQANTIEQSTGWYFNEDYMTLLPEPDGTVFVPKTAIKVKTAGNAYVQRGRRMWNRAASTFTINAEIATVITQEVPFDDLPMLFNNMIAARAVLEFQAQYDAEGEKYQKLLQRYGKLYSDCKAEDIRQRKVNVFNQTSVAAKLRRVRPMSEYTKGLG